MLNETLQIISIVLCLVGILQVLVGPKRWRGSVFFHIVFYIALFNYAISILLGLILEGHEGELVHRVMFISNFLEFISGYSLTFFVIKWLLHCVDPMREVKEIRVANILALVLYVLQLLMVIVSQFTGLCYSIGNDNYLQFGEGFFLLVLMWVPSLLLALYVLIRFGKRLPVRYIISFSIFAVISATGVAAQFFLIDIYYNTTGSHPFSSAESYYKTVLDEATGEYVYEKAIDAETGQEIVDEDGNNVKVLDLTLTTKGFIYTVVSNGNEKEKPDDAVANLTNKTGLILLQPTRLLHLM